MAGFGLPTSFKTSGLDGTPYHDSQSTTTSPGTAKLVYMDTVPASVSRSLHTIYFSCSIRGKMVVKLDGVIIGVGRSAPGKPDISFPYFPSKPLGSLQVLTVEFTARSGSPIVDCDTTIMATDQ